MVRELVHIAESNQNVGIVAPDIVHKSGGIQKYWVKEGWFWRRRTFKGDESALMEVNTVISSGSLIPLKIINKIGGMREDYFIDYIEIEFCLRVRNAGYQIAVIKNAKLIHSLGERKTYTGLGIEISPTNHSALRKYYMTKNRVITWRIYGGKNETLVIHRFGKFFLSYDENTIFRKR